MAIKGKAVDPDEEVKRKHRDKWVEQHPRLEEAKTEAIAIGAREAEWVNDPYEYVERVKRHQKEVENARKRIEQVRKELYEHYDRALGLDDK